MKRTLISSVVAATLALALVPVAQAATVDSGFTVQVSLTAVCTANAAGAALDFGSYTAFGNTHNAAPTLDLTFNCTRGLAAPTYSFDAGLGGNNGVLAGLNYTLGAAAQGVAAGTTATPGVAGTADVRTVRVTGGMAGGQAGEAPVGAASHVRTLTVTY